MGLFISRGGEEEPAEISGEECCSHCFLTSLRDLKKTGDFALYQALITVLGRQIRIDAGACWKR
jgi:hypothetical protein